MPSTSLGGSPSCREVTLTAIFAVNVTQTVVGAPPIDVDGTRPKPHHPYPAAVDVRWRHHGHDAGEQLSVRRRRGGHGAGERAALRPSATGRTRRARGCKRA